MTDNRAVRPRPSRGERALLLVALLGAPVAWAFHLFGSYLYVPAACGGAPMWGFHVFTVVALGALAGVALLARSFWRERIELVGTYLMSTRQVGVIGLLLTGFFVVLVLLEAFPHFITDPCIGLGVPGR